MDKVHLLLLYFPIFVLSLTIHEYCHGWVAYRKGDSTAKLMGRLTLNPIPHLDPIGTVVLPLLYVFWGGIPFAWAKPVPVNPLNFRRRVEDMFWVALAGPGSNFILAFISAFIFGMVTSFGSGVFMPESIRMFQDLTVIGIRLNLMLCFFNLLPIAPLDGSKIIGRFLPDNIRSFFESIHPMSGMIVLLALMMTGVLSYVAWPVFLVGRWLEHLFLF